MQNISIDYTDAAYLSLCSLSGRACVNLNILNYLTANGDPIHLGRRVHVS